MRIALIHTDRDKLGLGIRTLSTILKKAEHQTKLIFLGSDNKFYSKHSLEELESIIKGFDIICISCFSRGSEKAKQVCEHLRPLNKLIVWGGLHATLNPSECAGFADVVCVGEGEGFILELMKRVEQGKNWQDMENAVFRNNGKVVNNPLRPLINDLDELPLFDFTCTDEMHLTDKGLVQLSKISNIIDFGQIVFIGSRGCALQCTYCCNAKLKEIYSGKGRYIRKITITKYIEHARMLHEKYFPDGKYFFLIDEDFFSRDVEELREFADKFPKEVGLPFECCGSPLRVTQEKMELLVKAGLWRIRMGIESGSERTKKEVYNRFVSNKAVIRAARIISKYPQVVPYYFFIITNPYEKPEDLLDSIRFIRSLPHHFYMQAFNLVFFPGSVLYERAIQDRLIEGKQDSGYELDFRGGLRYKGHAWKYKNLYLNGILFMMEGKSTRYRLGLLPRFIISFLIYPKILRFNNKYPAIIRYMIRIKMDTLSLRNYVAKYLKRIISDPTAVYNIGGYIKNQLKRS